MKYFYLLFIVGCISLVSCSTNKTINGLKCGKWITYDTINKESYKYIAYYRKGKEIKTWKTFKNNKIYKKEKNKSLNCFITYYHNNGKIAIEGQAKTIEEDKITHWYYYGDWKYFNENGKLIEIKKYEEGELKSEIEIE